MSKPTSSVPKIGVAEINAQIDWMTGIAVEAPVDISARLSKSSANAPPGKRQIECFVRRSPSPLTRHHTPTLGHYARWLVAARMLLVDDPARAATPSASHESGTNRRSLREVLGVKKVDTDRVFFGFHGPPDKAIPTASRYGLSINDKTTFKVLSEVIVKLNEKFAEQRGSQIDGHEFLDVHVPVGFAEAFQDGERGVRRLGKEPLEWFEHWIRFGVGMPRSDSAQFLGVASDLTPLAPELGSMCAQIVSLIREGASDTPHRRVVNAVLGPDLAQSRAFSRQLYRELHAAPRQDPLPVVYVNLSAGASRKGLLRELYRAFASHLPVWNADGRPIDLARDLEPIRRALCVSRAVVIFDGWDNVRGQFHALHEYLCNTHWGEVLRVLAQPHLPALRVMKASGICWPPRFWLIVLSARHAAELDPWSVHLRPVASAASRSAVNFLRERPARHAATQWADGHWSRHLPMVVGRFVAASVNGLRRDTLMRCLEAWVRVFWGQSCVKGRSHLDHLRAFDLDALLAATSELIEVDDEEVESLSPLQLNIEVARFPGQGDMQGASGRSPKVITFASRAARTHFMRQWWEEESGRARQQAVRSSSAPKAFGWSAINLILATEALMQQTVQLRHLRADGMDSPYSMRRTAQAIYHCLMSGTVHADDFAEDSKLDGSGFWSALPGDVDKRYRYAYNFLYRNVLEGGEWRLGRAFGRSDVRLDLLSLFLTPAMGHMMLISDEDDVCLPGVDELASLPTPLRQSPALFGDLVKAIGRAGSDLAGARGSAAVEWALTMLPRGRNSAATAALLPARGPNYYQLEASALKLRIDWLQAKGHPRSLRHAKRLCWQALANLGIDSQPIQRLERLSGELLRTAARSPREFSEQLHEALNGVLAGVRKRTGTFDSCEMAAALLFRVGEILATSADDLAASDAMAGGEGRPSQSAEEAYAYAWAVYWVADRIRSGGGTADDAGVAWPLVSARAVRYWIRVALELADRLAGRPGMESFVTSLIEHAHSKIAMYTRHHYRFQRERDSMVMLEVDRLRTWCRVNIQRANRDIQPIRDAHEKALRSEKSEVATGARKGWPTHVQAHLERLHEQYALLAAAWDYLGEAEDNLFALGFQRGHVRRLFLERIKTATVASRLAPACAFVWVSHQQEFPVVPVLLQVAQGLLVALEELSQDNGFWTRIAERQRVSLKRAINRWENPQTAE